MKTKNPLKELLFDSSRSTADLASDMLLQKPERLVEFFSLACSDEYPWDMRASNVIEKADERQRGFAFSLIPEILNRLLHFKSDGPKRQFLRMIIRYVAEVDEDYTGLLYDVCFELACDPVQSVAVRHNAIQVLDGLADRYPDIANEIFQTLALRLHDEKEPFATRLRELIQKRQA